MPDLRFYYEGESMLGEMQWKWLEDVITGTNDDLYVIVSGIQMFAFNRIARMEHWPKRETNRLLQLLEGKPSLFVSGDVHHA
jgi:hypothetical protein